ncbi:MAG: ABC transporter ATP-binding protein [Arcobacter sp.]|nr:ABC transporter ATP-binding protein [Arcobacter sp.]
MLNIKIDKKFYKDELILKNIKIEFKKNEIISIIGPSGCGKTTLLNLISSLDNDFYGKISFKEKKEIDNLGFMFQDFRLLPWLSVKENISLVQKIKDEDKIKDMLSKVSLEKYIHSHIKELSGGMKRRVSLVRTFINNPEVLLLDEPFISLDEPTAKKLRILFLELYSQTPANTIFITHDLLEALSISDRILFLGLKPSEIIYEYINKNKSFDENILNRKKEEILKEYPEILSGYLT